MNDEDVGRGEQEVGGEQEERRVDQEVDETRAEGKDASPPTDTPPPASHISPPTSDVDGQVRRLSRRGFFVAGVSAIAAYGGWRWLTNASRMGDVPWPLRRTLETNEKLSEAYFRERRLSPTFPASMITNARINGGIGLNANYDMSAWQLNIDGHTLNLADIQAFPKREMITEFRCIEGWSTIAQWTGVRLADLMAKFPPPNPVRYVALETPGRGYYVGLDIASAVHPQTLLAWGLNGEPLTWNHGAPLRLAIPIKYGVKNIKRIATIRWTNVRPPDFWAEQGYGWYCGH